MKEKMIRFMQGRYGVDQLSKAMMALIVLLGVINIFLRISIISIFIFILLAIIYYRMFSKNVYKRYEENRKYTEFVSGFQNRLRKEIEILKLRKDYRIYICPTCKQKIKIPKGKGKIAVRCPKCRTEFVRKS